MLSIFFQNRWKVYELIYAQPHLSSYPAIICRAREKHLCRKPAAIHQSLIFHTFHYSSFFIPLSSRSLRSDPVPSSSTTGIRPGPPTAEWSHPALFCRPGPLLLLPALNASSQRRKTSAWPGKQPPPPHHTPIASTVRG